MTCDTVWCVTGHFTGQYDLWCHINFIITQPPNKMEIDVITSMLSKVFPWWQMEWPPEGEFTLSKWQISLPWWQME